MAHAITQARLQALLRYDPDTGLFTWKISKAKMKAGAVAGGRGAKGYWMIGIDSHRYYAHVLAWVYMTGSMPTMDIDHKDRQRTHNAWENLRLATKTQNAANAKIPSTNTSGYKGVSKHAKTGKWFVCLRASGKTQYLGLFQTVEEAHRIHDAAAHRIHGDYARTF